MTQEQNPLLEGPVIKAIASISLPMLLMMVTAIGFNFIDARYISLLGPDALTGLDITFPFLTLSSSMIYGGLGSGVSAIVARRHARKNDDTTPAT